MKKIALATLLGLATFAQSADADHKHNKEFYKSFNNVPSLVQELKGCQETYMGIVKLGEMYYKDNNYGLAISVTQKAINMDSANYLGWHNLSACYIKIKEIPDALKTEIKALTLAKTSEDFVHVYGGLAVIYSKLGDFERAREFLNKGLNIDYNNSNLLLIQSKLQQ